MAGRVEPGVTGKEKLFQQSREFGPGAMKPYVGVHHQLAQRRYKPPDRGGNTKPSIGSGVYHGPTYEHGGLKGKVPFFAGRRV